MKFWGAEVKSGQPLEVQCGDDFIIHLSQASLGEVKKDKGNEPACLYVRIGNQKLVLGTLTPEKLPQLSFDLVFDQDFELSHNWKNGSIYFIGYKVDQDDGDDGGEFDSEMEDLQLAATDKGKPESEAKQTKPMTEKSDVPKPDSSGAKKQVKIAEPSKDMKPDEETDDSSDEEDDDDESSSDDQGVANGADAEDDESDDDDDDDDDDDNDESDDGSDEEDEETPKKPLKAELGKKRSAESATKTPIPDKKAKIVTPQKPDVKKVGDRTATPHPAKQASKLPSSSNQKKEQTQKSFTCKPCNRSFGSENALQSHTKAKHSAA